MALRRPSRQELVALSDRWGLELTEAELADYHLLVDGMLGAWDALDQFPEPVRGSVPARRQVAGRPSPEEDPYNGIVRRVDVYLPGAEGGPLAGRAVGIKDTVQIAGVPMTCASRLLADFVPDADATVVRRILEAGGRITAITNTDDFGFAGTGHTSAYGPTRNPRHPDHVPGGSSCGSAIVLATEVVDFALGGDQGGSIRIPAAWTGLVGLMPTHGLVPYTGIVGFDLTIDHIGPMARTVADTALLLSILAGADDTARDPRQPDVVPLADYLGGLDDGVAGLTIGVLAEGFGTPASDPVVDAAVRAAAEGLATLGARVETVSIPRHASALPIWTAVAVEGGIDNLYHGLHVYQSTGWYDRRLQSAVLRGLATNGGDLSATTKLGVLVGQYVRERYQGTFYGRAQNLARELHRAYDAAFQSCDLLLLPTTPQRAHAQPPSVGDDRMTYVARALDMIHNTAPFNLTGHPSISVPCHGVDGLPVGLMLVGRHFADATVLRAARAHESLGSVTGNRAEMDVPTLAVAAG